MLDIFLLLSCSCQQSVVRVTIIYECVLCKITTAVRLLSLSAPLHPTHTECKLHLIDVSPFFWCESVWVDFLFRSHFRIPNENLTSDRHLIGKVARSGATWHSLISTTCQPRTESWQQLILLKDIVDFLYTILHKY